MTVPTAQAPTSSASRLRMPVAFAVATCSFVLVFATAGTPIPLYNLYQAQDGITHADLGAVSVGYFVAAAGSLLILGRISNHWGRRPVALTALASAVFSCLILIQMHGVWSLLLARISQGLACGLASSGLGSYVIDSAPQRPRWLSAAITGSTPMLGIPIGAIACGALVEHGPAPRVLIFVLMSALLIACALLIMLAPETVARAPGAIRSMRPRLQIPAGAARPLVAVGAAAVATWSLGGFYQAYGPAVAAEYLATSNALVVAAIFGSVMVLNPVGAALSGRFSPPASLRGGLMVFVVALIGLVTSLHVGAILLFIGASLLIGLAQGAASTGAMRALLSDTQPGERAGLLSTVYLISYIGATVPGVIAARLTSIFSLYHIALGYAALGIIAAMIAVVAMQPSKEGGPESRNRQRSVQN